MNRTQILRYSLAYICANAASAVYFAWSPYLASPSIWGFAIANLIGGCLWGHLKIDRGDVVVGCAAITQAALMVLVFAHTEPLVLVAAAVVGGGALVQVLPVWGYTLLRRG